MNIERDTTTKLIFKGRLEFGSERTFRMALRHWETRVKNYFKTEVLLKADEVFNTESYTLDVPQQVIMSTEKHWRSTTDLLKEIAQYALAGNVGAWWVNSGHVLGQYTIEPQNDRSAVAEFIRGRELTQQGALEFAQEALSSAISKFERNALAYERRGYVNYKLKNFKDAQYDFSKSIQINPNNPEPYYGRGMVRMIMNDWEPAIQDFNAALEISLAVQPVHWLARLRKAECLFHCKRFAEAAPELKLFLQKQFPDTHPVFRFRPKAEYLLEKVSISTGSYYIRKEAPEHNINIDNILADDYLMMEYSKSGISSTDFLSITSNYNIPLIEWARFIQTNPSELQLHINDNITFSSKDSERILEIHRVLKQGVNIFGSSNHLVKWLYTDIPALGGKQPQTFLDNTFGLIIIRDELTRIEHGIFS